MITIESYGNFKRSDSFLNKLLKRDIYSSLEQYAKMGVNALAAATPKESGETANSWGYEIKQTKNTYTITWTNTHVVDGVPIAIILQYGHGTGTGGYIKGTDYINPALRPVFDKIADNVWKAVTSA